MTDADDHQEAQKAFSLDLGELENELFAAYEEFAAVNAKATADDQRDLANKNRREYVHAFLMRHYVSALEKNHYLICNKLKYCQRSKSEPLEIAIDLADAFMIAKISILSMFPVPIPTIKVAAYIIRAKILDPFCKCDKSGGINEGQASAFD